MRPRKKQNLGPRLDRCAPILIENPEEIREAKGSLRSLFPNPGAPLMLEIGCGKGKFIRTLAKKLPEVNFIAMEREPNVAVVAAEQALAQSPPLLNLRFLLRDAENVRDYFNPGELERIYINFCDPWHKHRQYKRRLTYRERLLSYCTLLRDRGEIQFKTDNYMLYHFSTFEFDSCMERYFSTSDLHKSEFREDNVTTEYEEYFSGLGQPIYAIRARKRG